MSQPKSHDQVLETEFSEVFVRGMKCRMVVSFFKYGAIRDAYPAKVDAITSMQRRIDQYRETGNTECLMDAANFLMIEFMHPRQPGAFFKGTDSDQSPGRVTAEGKVTWKPNADIEGDDR